VTAPTSIVLSRGNTSGSTTPSSDPIERPLSRATRSTIALDRGDVLRIRDGRGTRLVAESGVLWVSEARRIDDAVLVPGMTHRIENDGTAVVVTHRPGRLILEVPTDVPPPWRVELAMRSGEPGRRIRLDEPRHHARGTPAAAIARAIRKLVAAGRGLIGLRVFSQSTGARTPPSSVSNGGFHGEERSTRNAGIDG